MKRKNLIRSVLPALLFMLSVPSFSQEGKGSEYNSVEASKYCGENLSAYREFFRLNYYEFARSPWQKVFDDCPGSSEKMYVDGATMYRSFIEKAPEGPTRDGLIDTLMLIYDRRMEYFGGEGNVLGRKGRDLLTLRGSDPEQVQKAYEMLRRSIELSGKESQEPVMVLLISAGSSLKKEGIIDESRFIEDYILVTGILGSLDQENPGVKRSMETVDEIVAKEFPDICEALNSYYELPLEQNMKDITFLEKVILTYQASGCDGSEVYLKASENLYMVEPGPESAHNLAILLITRNEIEKASGYLEEAVKGENTPGDTRAEWYYKLAVVTLSLGDHCKAIDAAREAIKLRSNLGKAYILLGDAMIASSFDLADDFQQRTAYWAAADEYKRAASADPSLQEEANQKLASCVDQYPSQEDLFFRDIKEGDNYLVGGCINENTTARSRK